MPFCRQSLRDNHHILQNFCICNCNHEIYRAFLPFCLTPSTNRLIEYQQISIASQMLYLGNLKAFHCNFRDILQNQGLQDDPRGNQRTTRHHYWNKNCQIMVIIGRSMRSYQFELIIHHQDRMIIWCNLLLLRCFLYSRAITPH